MGENTGESSAEKSGENLDVVIRSIRRTRNKLIFGFLLVLAFGIALIAASIFGDEAGIVTAIFGIICVLLALFGVKIIWPNLKPEKSPLIVLLKEHPENIAWIFKTVDPGSGGVWGKSFNIVINDTDKKAHTFAVKAADLDELMETLKSKAPRAAIGLTDEIKKKYQQDPWSVMSDE